MMIGIKGKTVRVKVLGDKNRKMFYAEILYPGNQVYMTGKFTRLEKLHGAVEKWARKNNVKLDWTRR